MRRQMTILLLTLAVAGCDVATGGGSATLSGARPDATRIAPGTELAFGEIATVCDLSRSALGTAVATASGYTLYDTAPTSTAARTQYVTGFQDGCTRQVTAALSLFGEVATHEVVRYQTDDARQPYTPTDTAYEEVKGQICGVASGTPCGAAAERLARNTAFLTLYPSFGASGRFADILLHDGQVAAIDVSD